MPENITLILCLLWLGFKVNYSLLIELFGILKHPFFENSKWTLEAWKRGEGSLVLWDCVFGVERLRQYVPEEGDREGRLVVKLLYWELKFGCSLHFCVALGKSVIGKIDIYQGQANQKWSCGDSSGCGRAQGSCLGSCCCQSEAEPAG